MANKSFTRHCQYHKSDNASECKHVGHLFQKTFLVGERLCTRYGIKVYCPFCTAHIPSGVSLIPCPSHTHLDAEIRERSVR